MKKLFVLMMAVALCGTAIAKKDKKKAAAEPAKPAVVLANSSDSISYAAGYSQTNGLIPFLLQQKVDTAYMADFVNGLKEAMSKNNDPAYYAHQMGFQIASMVRDRFIPSNQNDLKDTPDSLVQTLYLEGFYASLAGDTTLFKQDGAESFFQARMQANQEAKKEKLYGANRRAGAEWLADNAKKEGVVTLPSGLQYKVLVEGTGVKPASKTENVTVKYEGKLIDGTVFDSSYTRNPQTTDFKPSQVIPGWTEALMLMPVGSTWELYIPYDLAYGEREAGKITPYSALIFKVELIDCDSAKEAAKAEEEAKAAAEAAKKPAKKASKKK